MPLTHLGRQTETKSFLDKHFAKVGKRECFPTFPLKPLGRELDKVIAGGKHTKVCKPGYTMQCLLVQQGPRQTSSLRALSLLLTQLHISMVWLFKA